VVHLALECTRAAFTRLPWALHAQFLTLVLPSSITHEEVAMTAKASISLTDEQDAYARSLVESGRYPSLSAVLQRGLEMLRSATERQDAELQALRLLIDQRRTGAFVDIDVGEAETRAMLARKRNARAAL
jgi:antitoxin ParD1/3/4